MSLAEGQKGDVEVTQEPYAKDVHGNVDAAWTFLDRHRDVAAGDIPVDIDALRRKIDWRIVPLMFCCYTMQFLDKVILNVRAPAADPAEFLTRDFSSTLQSWALTKT